MMLIFVTMILGVASRPFFPNDPYHPILFLNCWVACGRKSGPCDDFCGVGNKCCRKNWNGGENGCTASEGGENSHECVGAAEPEGGAATLIKANVECNSDDVDLGTASNLEACAQKCLSKVGCEFLIYGNKGKEGHCYWEKTRSGNCEEGWEKDEYDFYSVKKSGPVTLIKANVECNSSDVDLGTTSYLEACAQKCLSKVGCEFVSYGNKGKEGYCYWEKTRSGKCEEGWEEDDYDFFRVEKSRTCALHYQDKVVIQNQYPDLLLLQRDQKPTFTKIHEEGERTVEKFALWKILNKSKHGEGCVSYGDDILLENQYEGKWLLQRNEKPTFAKEEEQDERIANNAAVWKILSKSMHGIGCVSCSDEVLLENQFSGKWLLQRNEKLSFAKEDEKDEKIANNAAVWKILNVTLPSSSPAYEEVHNCAIVENSYTTVEEIQWLSSADSATSLRRCKRECSSSAREVPCFGLSHSQRRPWYGTSVHPTAHSRRLLTSCTLVLSSNRTNALQAMVKTGDSPRTCWKKAASDN